MSLSTHNDLDRSAGAIQAEETLRLIASLPAPEGIEERVKAAGSGPAVEHSAFKINIGAGARCKDILRVEWFVAGRRMT